MTRFLLLYALAWGGGAMAYTPLLTILLPVQVVALTGQVDSVRWLAYLTFVGAIAASLAHIGFGYLSDITRRRRPWIALGLALSSVLLVLIGHAGSFEAMLVLIVAWQLSLNMMLAPLAALAGDCVPDDRKGLLGGLLAFAPALGALSGTLVTGLDLGGDLGRTELVAMLVVVCVVPVLLVPLPAVAGHIGAQPAAKVANRTVTLMWFARLAVQIAEAALFAYLYLWFLSIDPAMTDSRIARIFGIVLFVSAPLALLAGHFADRHRQPILPLLACALVSAFGLVLMALASGLALAITGYVLFGLATTVFLSLHSAQTLRVLRRADRRGRDLGLFNLTNTVPSLVMPGLVLVLVPKFGFAALFAIFALLAAVAAVLLAGLRKQF